MDQVLATRERSRLIRRPDREVRDFATVASIIDEALVCHVAFVEDGQPFVIPATPWRIGRWLYLHGAMKSRLIRHVASNAPVCVSIALVDALIFAGSAMMHSTDYRSVVLFGQGEAVEDEIEKACVLKGLVDKLSPGRSNEVTPPSGAQLAATGIVRLSIEEGAAKVRSALPSADPKSLAWIGRIPLKTVAGAAEPVGESALPPPLPVWLR